MRSRVGSKRILPARLEGRIGFERDRELPRIGSLIIAHGMLDIGCVDEPEAIKPVK